MAASAGIVNGNVNASLFQLGCHRLGIAYSAGTFTVQGANAIALGNSNPGYVSLPSKATPGKQTLFTITANQTFTDGSSGTTDNQRFGLTTGVNWAQDIPFYLYAVMDDTEALIAFMISRDPAARQSPTSTSIGKTGAIVNVGQGDFFSLADVTLTSYDNNPCVCLGAFRMQFVGATDSWTVQTLGNNDGIGLFHEQTMFTMPSGVNGSASGTYFQNGAGTEPTFTTNTVFYKINRSGNVFFSANFTTVSNVPAGANPVQLTLPYTSAASSGNSGYFGAVFQSASGSAFTSIGAINSSTISMTGVFFATTFALNNSSLAANDSLSWVFNYQAY